MIDIKKTSAARVVFMPFRKSSVQYTGGRAQAATSVKTSHNAFPKNIHKPKPATTLVAHASVIAKKKTVDKKTKTPTTSSKLPVASTKKKQKPDSSSGTKKEKKVAHEEKIPSVEPVLQHEENHSSVISNQRVEVHHGLNQGVTEDEVLYVGVQELDMLELHNDIRAEIERVWHPPVGIASGKSCLVKIRIAWDGTLDAVDIEQRSGIIAFDTSVRHAVLKMQFPKGVYGKTVCIPFVQ